MTVIEADPNLRFMDAMAEFAIDESRQHVIRSLLSEVKAPEGLDAENKREWELRERERIQDLDFGSAKTELTDIGYGTSYYDELTPEVVVHIQDEPQIDPDLDARNAFLGNLIVENGHAEYDRVTSGVFEAHPVFREWKNIWVAEEKPHGDAMEHWAWATGYVDMKEVHAITQGYLRKGLTLDFKTPAHGMAYPALQERATELTHMQVMTTLPKASESIAASTGRDMMARIIANERGHKKFYSAMVRHALESGDPEIASMQMLALGEALMGFAMPGMDSDIPRREEITKSYEASGVFSYGKLATDVLLPAIDGAGTFNWDVENVTDLTDEAKRVRDDIVAFSGLLKAAKELDDPHRRDRKLKVALLKAHRQYGRLA
ncbi:acyl-ACP desaturase [Candidatus Saccharibacteria bacterium]|nr:acyl-ACP desaturase [Candidatus Saccharibacteria bacterium]